MNVYVVRKRRGQWTICADEKVLLNFETYNEAIETARGAVEVLSEKRSSIGAAQPVGMAAPGPSSATG